MFRTRMVFLCCAVRCAVRYALRTTARAVQPPWRQLAMCSVCKLARVAESALAVFSKYDRCAAAPQKSLVKKTGPATGL